MKNALVAFAIILVAACQPDVVPDAQRSTQEGAILNGRTASLSEIGATVALLEYGDPICSGTLIAPRVVLTAAHCLSNVRTRNMEVVAGSIDSENAPQSNRHDVDRVVSHDDFSEFGGPDPDNSAGLSEQHDIGLVILEEPVTNVQPATIPSVASLNTLNSGDDVIISGFGITSLSNDNVPDLQIATTLFIRRSSTEILAGGPADTCYGDSGGPLYLDRNGQRYVIGATSRGAHDSQIECGDNGIYTLAPSYLDWIETNAQGLFVVPDELPPADDQCAGQCGSTEEMPGGCYCDAQCASTGDCCPGYAEDCAESEAPEIEEPETGEPETEEPVTEPETETPGTSCYESCGGLSSDGCWCDAACVNDGSCCDDYEEECTEGTPALGTSDDDEEIEIDNQDEDTASPTGTWTCDISRFVDDVCDCGCGVIDPACSQEDVNVCEEIHCDSGLVYDDNNARCMGEIQPLELDQSCSQSGGSAPSITLFALALLFIRRKLTKEP